MEGKKSASRNGECSIVKIKTDVVGLKSAKKKSPASKKGKCFDARLIAE